MHVLTLVLGSALVLAAGAAGPDGPPAGVPSWTFEMSCESRAEGGAPPLTDRAVVQRHEETRARLRLVPLDPPRAGRRLRFAVELVHVEKTEHPAGGTSRYHSDPSSPRRLAVAWWDGADRSWALTYDDEAWDDYTRRLLPPKSLEVWFSALDGPPPGSPPLSRRTEHSRALPDGTPLTARTDWTWDRAGRNSLGRPIWNGSGKIVLLSGGDQVGEGRGARVGTLDPAWGWFRIMDTNMETSYRRNAIRIHVQSDCHFELKQRRPDREPAAGPDARAWR